MYILLHTIFQLPEINKHFHDVLEVEGLATPMWNLRGLRDSMARLDAVCACIGAKTRTNKHRETASKPEAVCSEPSYRRRNPRLRTASILCRRDAPAKPMQVGRKHDFPDLHHSLATPAAGLARLRHEAASLVRHLDRTEQECPDQQVQFSTYIFSSSFALGFGRAAPVATGRFEGASRPPLCVGTT